MGLFSSSKKYYAFAASSSLFEVDNRPDTDKSLILQSAIGNETTISEAIKLALQTNMYARARAMIRYALKFYTYGLPETNQDKILIDLNDIKAVIEAEEGQEIMMSSVTWGAPRELFFLRRAIYQSYLNPTYFPWPAGNPADTTWNYETPKTEIPVVDPGAKNPNKSKYYLADSIPDYSRNSLTNHYNVVFNYTDTAGVASTWTVASPYDLTIYDNKQWIMVEYQTLTNIDDRKYWIYELGSGANPDLEANIVRETINLSYLPIAILMQDQVWFDEQSNAELEKTTYKLLKKLTLDVYDVKEDYLEQVAEDLASGETTGDEAEVWDFYIHFMVPIHSTVRGSREYIFHFLQYLQHGASWTFFEDYQNYIAGGTGDQPASELRIEEGGLTGLIISYKWSYVFTVVHPGVYTPPGWTEPLRSRRMYSKIYQAGSANYAEGIEEVHGVGTPTVSSQTVVIDNKNKKKKKKKEPTTSGGIAYHDYAVFTRQNSDNTYTQVLVMAPSMEYQINTSTTSLGQGGGPTGIPDYQWRFVDVELFPTDPEQESEFRFPVHIGSLRATSTMQREDMLSDALCTTVLLVKEVKVKWYQKTFFKWLIVIIVIIVVILAYQYQLLPNIAALAAASTGLTALGFYAIYISLTFALGFMITFAGGLVGGRLGQLFVIVAMYYTFSAAGGNPFSSINTAWGNMTSAPGWGTAFKFIGAVEPYVSFGMEVINDRSLAKLESDMRDFHKTMKEKYQELQDAWDSLGKSPDWLDPMDLIRALNSNMYAESPDSFFARSLNANPGILGYDLVNNFAQLAVSLPQHPGATDIIEGMFEDFSKQRGET